jgi:recombination protein RecA
MSRGVRKLTADASRTKTCVLFINQLRQKIGVMFGNPETTTGGNALRFFASVRLDVRRIGKVTVGETNIGNRTRVKVVKNKLAPPFQEAEFDIRWGRGIDRFAELLDRGIEQGTVSRSGSHFAVDGKSIGQGREKARDLLEQDPALARRLLGRVGESDAPGPDASPSRSAAAA